MSWHPRVLLSLLVSPMALVAKVALPGSALAAARCDVACAALLTGAGRGPIFPKMGTEHCCLLFY